MSNPLVWKCYGSNCQYHGAVAEFGKPGHRKCPKCGKEDVFPFRRYRCKGCRRIEDQTFWFPESSLDEDPGLDEAIPCEICIKREEMRFFRNRNSETLSQGEWDSARKKIQTKPTELEEIPVQPKTPRRTPASKLDKNVKFLT
jgi:hypothetical protein